MAHVSPVLEHREHDHDACESAALRHAEAVARKEGLRFTPQRRQVLEALLESHVPASAYDVIDRVGRGAGRDGSAKKLAPVSVYRALDFLVANNFAHRIESKSAYVACDRGAECEPGATLFLICDNCGAAAEASSETLGRLITAETKARAFAPRLRVLEVRGLCARCRQEAGSGVAATGK